MLAPAVPGRGGCKNGAAEKCGRGLKSQSINNIKVIRAETAIIYIISES
jgi:hypothetical protein